MPVVPNCLERTKRCKYTLRALRLWLLLKARAEMGISAVEQIHRALDKRRLNGPTIFRVSCAVWGTPEKDSVRHHVDMLEKVGYDRQEQIKALLTDYLKKLEGNDEQKIQKVAELFKDWDPDMKHELLRGIISSNKESDQKETAKNSVQKKETVKIPEQKKEPPKTPEPKKETVTAPDQKKETVKKPEQKNETVNIADQKATVKMPEQKKETVKAPEPKKETVKAPEPKKETVKAPEPKKDAAQTPEQKKETEKK